MNPHAATRIRKISPMLAVIEFHISDPNECLVMVGEHQESILPGEPA